MRIDGIDLRDVDPAPLRAQVALVLAAGAVRLQRDGRHRYGRQAGDEKSACRAQLRSRRLHPSAATGAMPANFWRAARASGGQQQRVISPRPTPAQEGAEVVGVFIVNLCCSASCRRGWGTPTRMALARARRAWSAR